MTEVRESEKFVDMVNSAIPKSIIIPQETHKSSKGSEIVSPKSNTELSPKRCPERPSFLSVNTSFYTNEPSFGIIKDRVEFALAMMEEYDWSYFEKDSGWRVKYFHGSNLREKYVYCYWDSAKEDHLIEVKRVRGDGLNNASSSLSFFFSRLKNTVLNQNSSELSHSKKAKIFGPLPLLSASSPSFGTSNISPTSAFPLPPQLSKSREGSSTFSVQPSSMRGFSNNQQSKEQFLVSVQPLPSMVNDQYYERRVEAAKMLCDLSSQQHVHLTLPEFQQSCLEALAKLLHDEFEDVRQFAVMAFASFAEIPCYQNLFAEMRSLPSVIFLIRNSPIGEPSYVSAQMRRKAAVGVALIAESEPVKIRDQLKLLRYPTKESWLDHCTTILDKRTREAAVRLGDCYSE